MPTKGVKKNNLGELHVAWEEEEGDTPPTSADSDEESHDADPLSGEAYLKKMTDVQDEFAQIAGRDDLKPWRPRPSASARYQGARDKGAEALRKATEYRKLLADVIAGRCRPGHSSRIRTSLAQIRGQQMYFGRRLEVRHGRLDDKEAEAKLLQAEAELLLERSMGICMASKARKARERRKREDTANGRV